MSFDTETKDVEKLIDSYAQSENEDPHILEIFQALTANIKEKDGIISQLQNDVRYLCKNFNEQERYSSKTCVIIRNLPLVTGVSYVADVIDFLQKYLGISIKEWDLQACHPLARSDKPNVIVKFVHYYVKDRVWARKLFLNKKVNPLNNWPIFMNKRLSKADSDLMDYARGLGLKVTTNNSIPQVFIRNTTGNPRTHNIVDLTDLDELFALGRLVPRGNVNAGKPQTAKRLPFNFGPHNTIGPHVNAVSATPKRTRDDVQAHSEDVKQKLKELTDKPDELVMYIDTITGLSPVNKQQMMVQNCEPTNNKAYLIRSCCLPAFQV